jgi:hypothetical protein
VVANAGALAAVVVIAEAGQVAAVVVLAVAAVVVADAIAVRAGRPIQLHPYCDHFPTVVVQ